MTRAEAPKQIAVFFFSMALFAALSPRLDVAIAFSFVCSVIIFRRNPLRFEREIWLPTGIALLCILDGIILFSRISWGKAQIISPYIRAPFSLDFERNLVLVSALTRDGLSPFLPGSPLSYQTLWHGWAALFANAFSALPLFSIVAACTLLTAFLFYFSLACILMTWLQGKKYSGVWIVILLILAATHAEVANLSLSLWRSGGLGIEADWSTPFPIYYRFVSLKLLSLVAPQHLLSLWCFLLLLRYGKESTIWMTVFLWLCLLTSPILSLMGAVPWALWNKKIGRRLVCVAAAFILAWVSYHFFFHQELFSYFSQKRSDEIWLFPLALLPQIPFIWILTAGALGALVTLAFVVWSFRPSEKSVLVIWLLLFGLAIGSNYIFSNAEVRRHASMVIAMLSLFVLVHLGRSKGMVAIGGMMAALALVCHGYFLYCYTIKDSALKKEIPYGDYFSMNELIRKRFPRMPVVAAYGSSVGVEMPIVLEATTSFVLPLSVFVHGRANATQSRLLGLAEKYGNVLPVARELGYQAILWGPIEEKIWHPRVKARFVSEDQLMARVGEVRLYRIQDRIKEGISDEWKLAESLERNGWALEAIDVYGQIAMKEPFKRRALDRALSLKLRLSSQERH
jgi:hypothetical protein